MISWTKFFENSSSTDALIDFVEGGSTEKLKKDCWDKECKLQVNKIKNIGVIKARQLARKALKREVYEI